MRAGAAEWPHRFGRPQMGEAPVGAVTAFAGCVGSAQPATASPPDASPPAGPHVTTPVEAWGWMLCDGRTLVTHRYPELFAALGYQYGGSGDRFAIPDYRGYFLRGVDLGAGNDPDVALRTVPPGASGSKEQVGSIQADALLAHTHDYQNAPAPAAATGSGNAATTSAQTVATSGPLDAAGAPFSPSTLVSKAENRPKNMYVHYLIKFCYAHR
jgi:microcystin-dependent protein